MSDLYEEFIKFENFYNAYKKVNKSKNRIKKDGIEFNLDVMTNIEILRYQIQNKTYKMQPYIKFKIYEPKERIIYAPSYRDKVVQIALNNILKNIVYPRFIPDSYGSIDNKGTHKAADKIQYNMRCAKRRWGDTAYTLKLNIKKFFYNIDRDILKILFRKHINDDRILDLLDNITDTAGIIGEKGIPLGNTISQLSANIYLNELDQHLKRKFGLKYYVRYMDDIIIQVESKEKAKEILEYTNKYVKDKLNLELNLDKSKYQPITHCVNSVGYKIWVTHRKLRKRSKDKFKEIMTEEDYNKRLQRFNSWYGHACRANCHNFIIKNLERR